MTPRKFVPKKLSYTEKMEFIRPRVSFDFKNPERLGRKNKRKITIYYNAIHGRPGKPGIKERHVEIKPPKGADFQKVQADVNPDFQHVKGVKGPSEFKVLWAPRDYEGAEVRFDRSEKEWDFVRTTVRGKQRSKRVVFDGAELVEDTANYLHRKLGRYPPGTQFRIFNANKTWTDPRGRAIESLIDYVQTTLAQKYGEDRERYIAGVIAEVPAA